MHNHTTSRRLVGLILATVFVTSPLLAQQRRSAPKRPAPAEATEPVPAFDSLLAADSYKVYCEVRAVGGLVRSPAVNDLLDPIMKLGRPPKEFKTLVKWLNAHAEVLAGSRMMVAGSASRPNLPNVLVAIEFSSPEEAKKFYPELRDFLPKLLPTPTPSPSPSPTQPSIANPAAADSVGRHTEVAAGVVAGPTKIQQLSGVGADLENQPSLPPYQMRQAGSLVLISDTKFTFRNLRPRGSKALEEDQNFQLARNRFATESIFLFVDLQSIEKEEKAQRQKYEEEEQKRIEAEAANPPKVEETVVEEPETPQPPADEPSPPPDSEVSVKSELVVVPNDSPPAGTGTLSAEPMNEGDAVSPNFSSFYSALFSGESKWPQAIGAAVVFENDSYVVRTLILNSEENKGNAIPFLPQLVSGPPMVPQSPEIFPADTELFVSASLDYPQIYEGLLKNIANAEALSRKYSRGPVKDGPPPESPFAFYEKKLGLKLKDDLLPLLGNEIALALPKKLKLPNAGETNPKEPTSGRLVDADEKITKPAEPIPIVAIAVKDREAVGRLIPKIIEALGFKGANLLAQSEKRDGTEIVSYAGAFSYAFVGDFLVVSPDAGATRHVVESYLNHQTLSSDSHFRNFTRWQPHQVLGQVYVGPDLMEAYNPFGLRIGGPENTKLNDVLSRLNPVIEPTTYALSNDGSGPLHELHIPRNLLQWMVSATLTGYETASVQANESLGQSLMRTVFSAEATFQATEGNGRYGSLAELTSANLISKETIENYGYVVEVMVSDKKFEATAVPKEYGVTGTLSYFIDESGVLRAGDHGGGAASVADQPVE